MLIALDGTWELPDGHTNVLKFFRAYQKNQPSPFNRYFAGVGTSVPWYGHIAGGLWGTGEGDKVAQAIGAIADGIEHEPLDIVGFSRGAATALDLANRIHATTPWTIRFLGLWDTVASFGVANLGWYFSKLTFGHQIVLPPDRVRFAFHAMALDERRSSFMVTRLRGAYEVWFRGVHGDVGGGLSVGLGDIALAWMLWKARSAGLPIVMADIAALHPTYGPPSLDRIEKFSIGPRRPKPADLVHYTVVDDVLGNPRELQRDEFSVATVSAAVV